MEGYVLIAEAPEVARVGRSQRAEASGRLVGCGDRTCARAIAQASEALSLRLIRRKIQISREAARRMLRVDTVAVR
jgi:hypothetical protein